MSLSFDGTYVLYKKSLSFDVVACCMRRPHSHRPRPTGGSKQIPLVLNRGAASERRVVDLGLHGPCWLLLSPALACHRTAPKAAASPNAFALHARFCVTDSRFTLQTKPNACTSCTKFDLCWFISRVTPGSDGENSELSAGRYGTGWGRGTGRLVLNGSH
jgi:hypothetical protein